MSAREVTDEVLARMANYDLIILNFANPDMVGHTGVVEAGIKAVETIDECVARIVPKLLALGGKCLITADHGNCEQMRNPDGSPNTAHTTNLVHFIYVARGCREVSLSKTEFWPTWRRLFLFLLGLPQPTEMTGHNLLVPDISRRDSDRPSGSVGNVQPRFLRIRFPSCRFSTRVPAMAIRCRKRNSILGCCVMPDRFSHERESAIRFHQRAPAERDLRFAKQLVRQNEKKQVRAAITDQLSNFVPSYSRFCSARRSRRRRA